MRWIAIAATAGMFLVLALGVVVTNTNSGHGCGGTWPLCNGTFVPEVAAQAAIEYTHRLVTGIEGLLVVALVLGALYYWRARLEIRILAPLMFLFLLIQSALGAIVALVKEAPELVAMHFGISLISFVSIVLTTAILLQERSYDRLRDRPVRRGFRRLVWGLTVYTYIVVYSGAYVQHTGVQLACSGWPLCNGQVIPTLTGGVAIVFTHRIAALVLTIGAVWLYLWGRQLRRGRPDLYRGSLAALVFVILQALEGAFVVDSRLNLASVIGHGALVSLYFAALCYLVLQVSPRPRELRMLVRPRQPAKAASPVHASPS